MKVLYTKLYKLLEKKGLTINEMLEMAHLSYGIAWKIKNNQSLNMESLGRICFVLDCSLGEIMDFDRRSIRWKNDNC